MAAAVAALSRRSGLISQSAITFAPGCAITLARSAEPRFPVPITPAPIVAMDCARTAVASAVASDPIRKYRRFTLSLLQSTATREPQSPETPAHAWRARQRPRLAQGAAQSARICSHRRAACRGLYARRASAACNDRSRPTLARSPGCAACTMVLDAERPYLLPALLNIGY